MLKCIVLDIPRWEQQRKSSHDVPPVARSEMAGLVTTLALVLALLDDPRVE